MILPTNDAELNASQSEGLSPSEKTCNIVGPSLATAHIHMGRLEPGGECSFDHGNIAFIGSRLVLYSK